MSCEAGMERAISKPHRLLKRGLRETASLDLRDGVSRGQWDCPGGRKEHVRGLMQHLRPAVLA